MTDREQQRAQVLTRWLARELGSQEAIELLGTSERQAWRVRSSPAAHRKREPDRRHRVAPDHANFSAGETLAMPEPVTCIC